MDGFKKSNNGMFYLSPICPGQLANYKLQSSKGCKNKIPFLTFDPLKCAQYGGPLSVHNYIINENEKIEKLLDQQFIKDLNQDLPLNFKLPLKGELSKDENTIYFIRSVLKSKDQVIDTGLSTEFRVYLKVYQLDEESREAREPRFHNKKDPIVALESKINNFVIKYPNRVNELVQVIQSVVSNGGTIGGSGSSKHGKSSTSSPSMRSSRYSSAGSSESASNVMLKQTRSKTYYINMSTGNASSDSGGSNIPSPSSSSDCSSNSDSSDDNDNEDIDIDDSNSNSNIHRKYINNIEYKFNASINTKSEKSPKRAKLNHSNSSDSLPHVVTINTSQFKSNTVINNNGGSNALPSIDQLYFGNTGRNGKTSISSSVVLEH